MLKEINVYGVYVSPFLLHLLEAALPFLALRGLAARTGLLSRLWHPAVFEFSLFVAVLFVVAYQ